METPSNPFIENKLQMPGATVPSQPKKRGCCMQGCIVLVVAALILGGGLGWGTLQVVNLFKNFTVETPGPLPEFNFDPAEATEVQQRVAAFVSAIHGGPSATGVSQASGTPVELRLSDRDFNILIRAATGWNAFKDRVYFDFSGGTLSVQTSFPLKRFPIINERYLIGTVSLKPVVRQGKFSANIASFIVNGRPLPGYILFPLNTALSDALTKGKGNMGTVFKGISSVETIDNSLVLRGTTP